MSSLFVLLPCYNEQFNIKILLEKWEKQENELQLYGYELHIVCIDDGSSDDTQKIIINMIQVFPDIILLSHEKNQGLGVALKTGLRYFNTNAHHGDIALVMDADNTHSPEYVFAMLNKMKKGADCVIASRFEVGASVQGVPAHRLFLTGGAKIYYSLILGVDGVKDYTCGYRIYSQVIHRAFEKYGENLITQNGFACMMEVLYKLSRLHVNFSEVPFLLHYDNKRGNSKMNLIKTICQSLFVAVKLRLTCKECGAIK